MESPQSESELGRKKSQHLSQNHEDQRKKYNDRYSLQLAYPTTWERIIVYKAQPPGTVEGANIIHQNHS